MSQYNELEQALKVADNPALCSTPERILAAEVRRLQAVNQTINAIWEEVDTYARNHSEIQLGESVSQHALELMRERDELRDRASKYQRNYAVLYDRLNGTPCAEIRWQSEREQLIERAEKAEAELDAERKRLDWALEHKARLIECVIWFGDDNDNRKWAETTNPRATIDELIAGEQK